MRRSDLRRAAELLVEADAAAQTLRQLNSLDGHQAVSLSGMSPPTDDGQTHPVRLVLTVAELTFRARLRLRDACMALQQIGMHYDPAEDLLELGPATAGRTRHDLTASKEHRT